MPEKNFSDIIQSLPFLKDAEPRLVDDFRENFIIKRIPKNEFIYMEGDECGYYAFVVEGIVRVYKIGESGRELTLYRLEKGESCILTASCVLSTTSFPAVSSAETDVTAVLIPAYLFRNWVAKFEFWRKYVFEIMSGRLATVIAVVDEITFGKLDSRIARLLLERESGGQIRITHQDIASDLGSSREVISRLLKDFEHEKIISISRGTITIQNKELLKEKI